MDEKLIMEDDSRQPQIYTVDGNPNFSCYARTSRNLVMMPKQKQPERDCHKVFTVITLILVFIILACLVLSTTYLIQLRYEFGKIKQIPVEKTAHANRLGKRSLRNSRTLQWEASKGNAFTSGVRYKHGSLIIDEIGHFAIYSKIYFRGEKCKPGTIFWQNVFKRTSVYRGDIVLMISRSTLYCSEKEEPWSRNSFQTGIFKLSKGDHIYVNVSDPNLVSFDQFYTFLGLHKI
ncbi:tumor necrosis factor ligand superfamily member 6-like isoform X2 [Narcine bancroftii]|uniref:tumor necrosis factor ligand superfamily member 6-like isoform X2 n=1 Tax=Narcine bancroftii TaxID=1343680 RepID=UPI0038315907